MPAGYSKRTLVEKLGIKSGHTIAIVNAPNDYAATLGELPSGVTLVKRLKGPLDLIQFFAMSRRDFERRLPDLMAALAQNGSLWVSWPKRASKVPTDLTEDVIRDIALRNKLVDVKVCAVDEMWSGLKLVYRLEHRK
jgi:hypothetical protein